jgi:hypothetical protein
LNRPGKENQVVDFLSRLKTSGEIVPVSDNFPDEHLFSISVITPWYADIVNYLSSGMLPPSLTSKEKKKIIKQRVLDTHGLMEISFIQDMTS